MLMSSYLDDSCRNDRKDESLINSYVMSAEIRGRQIRKMIADPVLMKFKVNNVSAHHQYKQCVHWNFRANGKRTIPLVDSLLKVFRA